MDGDTLYSGLVLGRARLFGRRGETPCRVSWAPKVSDL